MTGPAFLAYFDIDGTLLDHEDNWWNLQKLVIADVLGIAASSIPELAYAGLTDHQIWTEVLRALTPSVAPARRIMAEIQARYLERLSEVDFSSAGSPAPLPGTRQLLESIGNVPHLRVGLISGNVREAALLKLSSTDLLRFFETEISAFGDESKDRFDLPRRAIARASERLGSQIPAKQVTIVGDTPLDIQTAKRHGLRSIGVATGVNVELELLRAAEPDLLVLDLTDTRGILEFLTVL